MRDERDEHEGDDEAVEVGRRGNDDPAQVERQVDDAAAGSEPVDEPVDALVEEPVDEHDEPIGDLDDLAGGASPEDAVAALLRDALGTMREEADRIATLGTGEEQVEAAERFAEQAGALDEQVGAASRAADERD